MNQSTKSPWPFHSSYIYKCLTFPVMFSSTRSGTEDTNNPCRYPLLHRPLHKESVPTSQLCNKALGSDSFKVGI